MYDDDGDDDGDLGGGGSLTDNKPSNVLLVPNDRGKRSSHFSENFYTGRAKFGFFYLRQNWENFGQIWKLASVILVGLKLGGI